MIFSVKVQNFEGPLDLLLQLIYANEYDIFNLPINDVTHQYFEHLELMKQQNFDDIGDFFVLAATLLSIKSRLLLPNQRLETASDDDDDPREALVKKLLEYQMFKKAAQHLHAKPEYGHDTFKTEVPNISYSAEELKHPEEVEEFEPVSIYKLIQTFHLVSNKAKQMVYVLTQEVVSIKATVKKIVDYLSTHSNARYSDFLPSEPKVSDRVVSFLSVLELTKMGLILFFQNQAFADMVLEGTNNSVDVEKQQLDWE